MARHHPARGVARRDPHNAGERVRERTHRNGGRDSGRPDLCRFAVLELGSSQGGMVADVEPVLRDGGTLADAHPWTTAPVDVLLGTRIRREASGRVELEFRAAPALANERAGLHGGIGALMGERAAEIARRSASPDGHRFVPVELRIVFLQVDAVHTTTAARGYPH